ncbi:repeatdomain containing protein [Pyrenophora tritici-repentis]|nr:repeatdomain containing protein [Pyrenophora tritici-repentis]KAI1577874.1 repeatdomain containing protein [Pyrenophora tritici-repentis]KAI1589083.1 repeatdomain containing protein [Pyrenophora tritici-repentis]
MSPSSSTARPTSFLASPSTTWPTREGSFLLTLFLGNGLGAANDLALVVPELAFSIASGAGLGELLCISLDELTNDVTVGVDELASLVALETVKNGNRRTAVFVKLQLLLLSIFGRILSVFGGVLGILGSALSVFSSILSLTDLLLDHLGKGLDLADDVSVLVKYLALLVDLLSCALGSVTFDKLAD